MRLTGLPDIKLEKSWWDYAYELGQSVGIVVPALGLKWVRYKIDDEETLVIEFKYEGSYYGVIYRLSDLKAALVGPFATADDADNVKPEHVLATTYIKKIA